jgi:NADH-quinone oxidoreductase subunit N
VIGTMISLVYYLRVLAVVWMGPVSIEADLTAARPAIAGGSPEADAEAGLVTGRQLEVVAVAAVTGAATIVFGIVPNPLLHLAADAGRALTGLG